MTKANFWRVVSHPAALCCLVLLLALLGQTQAVGAAKKKDVPPPVSPAVASDDVAIPQKYGILILTPESFGVAFKKHKHLLVEYYVPWCGVCKSFYPAYQQLVKHLPRIQPGLVLAKINCEDHRDFCLAQDVPSYPTLDYFGNGKQNRFTGMAKLNAVLTWFDRLLQPSELIDTYAKLHHRRKNNDHSIVLLGEFNNTWAERFDQLAAELSDYKWFRYFGKDAPQGFPSGLDTPKILINNSETESIVLDLSKLKSKDELKKQVHLHRYPVNKYYNSTGIPEMIFEHNIPAVLFVFETQAQYKEYQLLVNQLRKDTLETAPLVVYIKELHPKDGERFLTYFGIDSFPFILYMQQIKARQMNKFYYRGKFERKDINVFVQSASSGQLPVSYRSKPKIPKEKQGTVLELVGDDFRDYVNPQANAFVAYYIPNCNFCDDMKEPFAQVAEEYKAAGIDLLFARVDNKNNETPDFFAGYPAVRLFKRGSEKTVDFTDKERGVHQFKVFLENNGFPLPKKAAGSTSGKPQAKESQQDANNSTKTN